MVVFRIGLGLRVDIVGGSWSLWRLIMMVDCRSRNAEKGLERGWSGCIRILGESILQHARGLAYLLNVRSNQRRRGDPVVAIGKGHGWLGANEAATLRTTRSGRSTGSNIAGVKHSAHPGAPRRLNRKIYGDALPLGDMAVTDNEVWTRAIGVGDVGNMSGRVGRTRITSFVGAFPLGDKLPLGLQVKAFGQTTLQSDETRQRGVDSHQCSSS
jgi:hypothetical protein